VPAPPAPGKSPRRKNALIPLALVSMVLCAGLAAALAVPQVWQPGPATSPTASHATSAPPAHPTSAPRVHRVHFQEVDDGD